MQPGYDNDELKAILPIMERAYDSSDIGGYKTPEPNGFEKVFRSQTSPLMNRFDVWKSKNNTAVIAIRGSIVDPGAMSFAAAFYCPMVAATGKIKVSETEYFEYKLAELPNAGVSTGILLGLYFISDDLVEQINILHQEGIKDIVIIGHSQGSAIANLATSFLWYLQKDGKIPADIIMKTYCIADPKVGNRQYALNYDILTNGGYALSVNNILDWVPLINVTLQSSFDFPPISPFQNLKQFFTDINFNPAPNFDDSYKMYSAKINSAIDQNLDLIHQTVFPRIKNAIPGYEEPEFMKSFDYERSGVSVPLVPDGEYYKLFPNDPATSQVWENHSVYPYFVLVLQK